MVLILILRSCDKKNVKLGIYYKSLHRTTTHTDRFITDRLYPVFLITHEIGWRSTHE